MTGKAAAPETAMSRRQRTPYDEDDDLDISTRQRYRPPSHTGVISAVSALISFCLLGTIGILWLIVSYSQNAEESALLIVGVLFLDLGAFVASLVGLVSGLRSQAAEQFEHRGYGLVGLIGSIICLLASLAVGVVSMCVGLFVAAVQNIPGG
jgi:hypothetical protein